MSVKNSVRVKNRGSSEPLFFCAIDPLVIFFFPVYNESIDNNS